MSEDATEKLRIAIDSYLDSQKGKIPSAKIEEFNNIRDRILDDSDKSDAIATCILSKNKDIEKCLENYDKLEEPE
ncbi:MAG: hypothetical protein O8C67_04910 [Candidatus Methanoperedens sp.]|nr:hypothetical protein [Candidatus Methanoperedens sp.]